jgi:hypothetical protein
VSKPGNLAVYREQAVRSKGYETRDYQRIESKFRHGSRLDLLDLVALSPHQFARINQPGLIV